jgi:hypothetical protein|uniref:Uncharacterized protein n=1 Tax=viral metagenome TaxID=1070528 RepID=A0A6C0DWT2_9ZZZZ
MIKNVEITRLSDEIANLEQNTNNITLIILVVENNELVNILKSSITTLNNRVPRKELIEHLKSIKLLQDYKVQYIYKFVINKSLEELNSVLNFEDCYKLTPFTNFDNLTFSEESTNNLIVVNKTFTRTNSLILIVTKIR